MLYKKINAVVFISLFSLITFAQGPEIHYQYNVSKLAPRLGPEWKLIKQKNADGIYVEGYIPKAEAEKNYSKMIAIGSIKKIPGKAKKQISLFDERKQKYLIKNQCDIKKTNGRDFLHFQAKSVTSFTYQCKKLRISGIDITLNANDPKRIYNIIYEFRTGALSNAQQEAATKTLNNMVICYNNARGC